MTNPQTTIPEAAELERLVDLAAELGVPIEQLAKDHRDELTLDAVGYRAVPAELATVLLDDKRRRDAEALERARDRAVAVRSKPRRRSVRPVPLAEGQTIVDLMLADAEQERGPVGLDRYWGPNADTGATIVIPSASRERQRRRPRGAR